MGGERVERRLTAILASDIAGYSRLMGRDEAGTLARVGAIRRELIDPKIAEHKGRIVKTTGDGILIEFPSVVEAVACAIAVQQGMVERNIGLPEESRIEFRIGINLGDVIVQDGDIYGDGVNVAARLEGLAEPGGVCVSGVVRDQVQGRLDCTFDDMGEQDLKNIARPVRAYRVRDERITGPAPPPGLALPDKPSLVVLPFQNMSGDPEQEYFADGMVEEITTAIARLSWLFVIARNSAFTYKGRAVDVKQVASELGVRYVLEGSVRKSGNRVRITGQLIDTSTGAHIWVDRFDGALDDIFDLQDQVASSVAGAIEPRLRQSEIERSARKPTENLGAYDFYLRALSQFHQQTDTVLAAALAFLREAIAIDPTYAPAAGLFAYVRQHQQTRGVALSEEEITEAVRYARQAVDTGKDDPEALSNGGVALAWLAGERAVALSAIERATTINPNNAHAWLARGLVNCFANRPEQAILAVQRAMRLSPLDPFRPGFKSVLALGLMLAGRYEEAMEAIDSAFSEGISGHYAIRCKIALCGYLGRTDQAREWIARLLALNPAHTIEWFKEAGKFLSPGTMAVWIEGFRRAGLPEE